MNLLTKDVIVIGGGQAGLAAGYYLREANRDFLILDKGEYVGESWKIRYDSLQLFTPRRYSGLPGLQMQGNPWGYPHKDEIADYLAEYQSKFRLPVQLRTEVRKLVVRDGQFCITTPEGEMTANQVVVTTGPFQSPNYPHFCSQLSSKIMQLHTANYQNPGQLPGSSVLVVGAGNSGSQIAYELSKTKKVYLSASGAIQYLPYRVLGRSLFWWYDKIGLLQKGAETRLGKKLMAKKDPLYGFELKKAIARGEVSIVPRAIGAEGESVIFEDGSDVQVSAVIWATGFKPDYSWIDIPEAFDADSAIAHERGVSTLPGLYYIGLPWQSARGSALIGWVHRDAEYIGQAIERYGERQREQGLYYDNFASMTQ